LNQAAAGAAPFINVTLFGESFDTFDNKLCITEHERNVVSEHGMWNNLTFCRYGHKEIISNEDIIKVWDRFENAVKTKSVENSE